MRTARVLLVTICLLLASCRGSRNATVEEQDSISRLTRVDPSVPIEEQLLRIPGVYRDSQGAIKIRGSVGSPLLVVDDVPAMGFDLSFINPADFATIEVLKGPATAIYGSRGGSGVVRLTTRRPPEND
jgi:TonB-dependent SusC/RagA subfamily outer membrane receptor